MPFPSTDRGGIFVFQPTRAVNSQLMKKEQIISQLQDRLDAKIAALKSSIAAITEARNNEDKCTVGDKYETGRAMTQMELEKSQAQLTQTENLKISLARIDPKKAQTQVSFGSYVETNLGNYFFSIAFGKIPIGSTDVFCLSLASPLGRLLVGKQVGDRLQFQGKKMEINRIL